MPRWNHPTAPFPNANHQLWDCFEQLDNDITANSSSTFISAFIF